MKEKREGGGGERERIRETESVHSVDDDEEEDDDNRSPGSGFNDVLGHSRRIPPPQLHRAAAASKLRESPYLPRRSLTLLDPLVLVDPRSRLVLVNARNERTRRLSSFASPILLY